MEWLTPLYGKTVGLDTAPLIYFIEKHPIFYPRIEQFFLAMRRGDFEVVTSTLTITETQVHPIRRNKPELATMYRNILLHTAHLQTIPVTPEIAETAARLRGTHNVDDHDGLDGGQVHARAGLVQAIRDPACQRVACGYVRFCLVHCAIGGPRHRPQIVG